MTLGEIIEQYQDNRQKKETARKTKTAASRIFGRLNIRMTGVKLIDIEQARKRLLKDGMKSQSVNCYCHLLSGLWSWAIKRSLIKGQINPFAMLDDLPSDEVERRRDLTPDEVHRLLDTSEGENRVRWAVYLYTGLRADNGAGLEWTMLSGNAITIPAKYMKNDEQIVIPLPEKCQQILDDWRDQQENKTGKIFSKATQVTLRNRLYKDCEKAGIDTEQVDLHALRHTFATAHLNNGTPLHIISKLLGHKSIQTTERYLHINEKDMAQAAHTFAY